MDTKLLFENWRSFILVETRKFLYHASPEHDIEQFSPRKFFHKSDFSHSGKLEKDQEPPEGYDVSDLVFAAKKKTMPFYSLPRDVPRILLDLNDRDTLRAIKETLPGFSFTRKQVVFLPEEMKLEIEEHSWTEYAFDKSEFEKAGGDVEFVSRKTVIPAEKKKYKNPLNYLKTRGFEVKFISDVHKLYDSLNNYDNIVMDAEGDFEDLQEARKLGKPSSETNLGDWFKRKGAPGKGGGWVDCNTCRNGKCKPCGRQEGEKRSKYPRCRPTPSQCKGYKRRGDNLQREE